MRRRRVADPSDWVASAEFTANGRTITRGTEVSIKGERGRFRFVKHITRPERGIEWLDFWGGPKDRESFRSFDPARIRTVHRLATTGENLLKLRKAAQ